MNPKASSIFYDQICPNRFIGTWVIHIWNVGHSKNHPELVNTLTDGDGYRCHPGVGQKHH